VVQKTAGKTYGNYLLMGWRATNDTSNDYLVDWNWIEEREEINRYSLSKTYKFDLYRPGLEVHGWGKERGLKKIIRGRNLPISTIIGLVVEKKETRLR